MALAETECCSQDTTFNSEEDTQDLFSAKRRNLVLGTERAVPLLIDLALLDPDNHPANPNEPDLHEPFVNDLQISNHQELQKRKIRDKAKEQKEVQAFRAEMPTKIVFAIKNGIRYVAPYWGVYRSDAKGRWFGRKLVEVFQKEFLSYNPDYVTAAVRRGRILVNGRQISSLDHMIQQGDRIEHVAHRHEHPVLDVPIQVLANTADLFVVNKPASMPVHACGNYKVNTVLGLLWKLHGIDGLRVLHRLDRTTSGVLLFAKNLEADRHHKDLIKNGKFLKEYMCLVEGEFPEKSQVCEQPIGTLVISLGIQCVKSEGGKSAKSTFSRVWYCPSTNQSLVLARIETGRTHQIRVHLQYLGYPIVDDLLYNDTVWGPTKGKNAEYGAEYEDLVNRVRDRHRAQLWLEEKDPDYDDRVKRQAESNDTADIEDWDSADLKLDSRPDFDPICLGCNVVKKTPTMAHMRMPLHCWRYETKEWCFKATLPSWAWPPPNSARVSIDPDKLYPNDEVKLFESGQVRRGVDEDPDAFDAQRPTVSTLPTLQTIEEKKKQAAELIRMGQVDEKELAMSIGERVVDEEVQRKRQRVDC